MSNNTRKHALPAKATMCQLQGHDWVMTASPTVKVCQRKECKQVYHLTHGHWRYATKLDKGIRMIHLEKEALKAMDVIEQMRLL